MIRHVVDKFGCGSDFSFLPRLNLDLWVTCKERHVRIFYFRLHSRQFFEHRKAAKRHIVTGIATLLREHDSTVAELFCSLHHILGKCAKPFTCDYHATEWISCPSVHTGAASGIGRETAKVLLRQGFNVGVCDLKESVAAEFASDIHAEKVFATVGDITDSQVQSELVDGTVQAFGQLDALVNNAATGGTSGTVDSLNLDAFRQTLEINVVSVVGLTQAVIPHLKKSTSGRIINLGSLFANDPVAGEAGYCSSKGAIAALSRTLAIELGKFGITCNTVAPGLILTEMHIETAALQAADRGISTNAQLEKLREDVPLARHGDPADVADTIAFLASEASGYISGQTLSVNGGLRFS